MLGTVLQINTIIGELIVLWVIRSPIFTASLDDYGMHYRLGPTANLWITFLTAMIVSLIWPLAFLSATKRFLDWLTR